MEIKPRLIARSDNFYGEFVIEPLMRGYGVTLGNPLRRILLSSIPGTAVTSVYIEDVLHEFSTIPGVAEDVVQLILNLKEMVVRVHSPGPKILMLNAKGPAEITAGNFEVDADVEIVNPDHHIATLNKDGKLVMEVRVEEGVGYLPSERHGIKERINSIPIDAVYSPVRRVAYHVEDTRVGQQTDLDRLIVRVWTNGSVTPQAAIDKAVGILRDQLVVFNEAEIEEMPVKVPVAVATVKKPASKNQTKLDDLGLTPRVLHLLREEGIDSVEALCALSERDLKKVPGIGERSLEEIKYQLKTHKLVLKE